MGHNLFKSGGTFISKTARIVHINCSTSSTPFDATNVVTFRQIRNPYSIKTTDSLQINLYTSGGFLIAAVDAGVSLESSSFTNGVISINSILPNTTIVQNDDTQYSFSFTPGMLFLSLKVYLESPLVATGTLSPKIVLTFPPSMSIGDS